MQMLLITYNLKQTGRNYESLFNAIKSSGPWWHYLDSIWLVYTGLSPTEYYKVLARHINGETDHLLVVEIKKSYQGWLPKEAWDWMNNKAF